MNKKELDTKINFSEYKEYRLNHTQKDTMSYFNLTRRNILYLDDKFNLDKDKLNSVASQKRVDGYRNYLNNLSEEEKEKLNKQNSERQKEFHKQHPECAYNHSKYMQKYYSDNENRLQQSAIMQEYFNNHPETKENISTGLKEYYIENPQAKEHLKEVQNSDAVKQKTRKTKLEKYGNDKYINIDKIKQTKLKRYGDETYNNKDKIKQTKAEKYGHSNYNNIDKIRNTCRNKYGCEYACMRPEARINSGNNSKPNLEFETLLKENNIEYEREFILENYSYDFKVGNILIEINPTATHNSTWNPFNTKGINKKYHYDKSHTAEKYNYRCIQVFDWYDKDKIINLLKLRDTIGARKCEIKEVSNNTTSSFINKYHLQNYAKSEINIGLYYNNELVSIMTFGKPRYNKNYEYELIRYCSSKNVLGGAEKLFKYFTDVYNPNSIISYCDRNIFSGNVYQKLGFKYLRNRISKHWYNPKTNIHITDNLLRQRGFDQLFNTNYGKGISNEQLMLEHGFVEIYDCGQSVYEWK